MLFTSPEFFIFLSVALAVFYVIPAKARAPWLLAVSCFFYIMWNPLYMLFLLFTTVTIWAAAVHIDKVQTDGNHADKIQTDGSHASNPYPDSPISSKENAYHSDSLRSDENKEIRSLTTSNKARRSISICFTAALIANLAVLFFFKYFDFGLQNVNTIRSWIHPDAAPLVRTFDLLLPVGISFYMFQAFSYLIDVRQGTITAERNFFWFFLYMAWFPKLTSGPIERAGNLLPQLRALSRGARKQAKNAKRHTLQNSISSENRDHPQNTPSREDASPWNPQDFQPASSRLHFSSGFGLMLWGLFMKMVIADRIAIFVDNIWANLFACGTVETTLAALGYSVQIYCDFAGYSCIAIGVSRMFGIELMQNFNVPCFARSISDFWHRWHISLSTWLRDYIYIPLGGSRCSSARKYRNILLTFLVSGIWHGAAWTFIIWGLLHGLYQIVGELLRPFRKRCLARLHVNCRAFSFRFGQVLVTFLLVSFAWIFFRAGSLSQALFFLTRMFTRWNPWVLFNEGIFQYGLDRREFAIFFAGLFLLLLAGVMQYRHPATDEKKGKDMGDFLITQNLAFRWAVYIALILIILVYGEYGVDFNSAAFIYSGF